MSRFSKYFGCKAALPSSLRGKYLIQNRWANKAFWLMDAGFAFWMRGKKRNFSFPAPKKILLSNIAHLGDVIMMTSLLLPLKKAFPEARIGVIVGSWARKIVENHPLIDFVHLLDHWKVDRADTPFLQKIRKTRSMFHAALEECKGIAYDVVVECNFHFPNTIFLTWRANIPVRIGYVSGGFGPLLTHPAAWVEQNISAAAYALDLILPFMHIGGSSCASQFESARDAGLVPSPILRAGDFEIRPALGVRPLVCASLPLPKTYLAIHMGSGSLMREWPLQKWRALCHKLIDDGHHLVFTGMGKREADAIEQTARGLTPVQNFCDRLSWEEWVALIHGAKALVSVETGAGHAAAAAETPSVLIYTGIHPFPLWTPLNPKSRILMHSVPCHPCRLSRGCAAMPCVRNVSVDTVHAAIRQILAEFVYYTNREK